METSHDLGAEGDADGGGQRPTLRSLATALVAGAVIVALAAVVSAVVGSERPVLWTCAVVVVVTALLTFVTLGTPLGLGGEGASHLLTDKIGREYFEQATDGRVDLMLHPVAFALPAIGTLLLLWAT